MAHGMKKKTYTTAWHLLKPNDNVSLCDWHVCHTPPWYSDVDTTHSISVHERYFPRFPTNKFSIHRSFKVSTYFIWPSTKLEQLERLRSEDTPPPHGYPYNWVILNPKSTEDKVKVTNIYIWKQTLHATYLVKLFDKICKFQMDPTSIIEDTERTRFCPQTDRRTDRRRDKV